MSTTASRSKGLRGTQRLVGSKAKHLADVGQATEEAGHCTQQSSQSHPEGERPPVHRRSLTRRLHALLLQQEVRSAAHAGAQAGLLSRQQVHEQLLPGAESTSSRSSRGHRATETSMTSRRQSSRLNPRRSLHAKTVPSLEVPASVDYSKETSCHRHTSSNSARMASNVVVCSEVQKSEEPRCAGIVALPRLGRGPISGGWLPWAQRRCKVSHRWMCPLSRRFVQYPSIDRHLKCDRGDGGLSFPLLVTRKAPCRWERAAADAVHANAMEDQTQTARKQEQTTCAGGRNRALLHATVAPLPTEATHKNWD